MGSNQEEHPSTPRSLSAPPGPSQPPRAPPQTLLRMHIPRLLAGLGPARQQLRIMEAKAKPSFYCLPSSSEASTGNTTGAAPGIKPGLRRPGNLSVRGHSWGSRTQAMDHSVALPAPSSEKRVRGAPLKRRQTGLPRASVPCKSARQGNMSSTCAKTHTWENTGGQPEDLHPARTQRESSQLFYWPPPRSPLPYRAAASEQKMMVSPSMGLHGALALPNTYSKVKLLPCPSTERHPLELQVPAEGPSASVSAASERQEILEAAEALLTLKNSSWTRRSTHS